MSLGMLEQDRGSEGQGQDRVTITVTVTVSHSGLPASVIDSDTPDQVGQLKLKDSELWLGRACPMAQ